MEGRERLRRVNLDAAVDIVAHHVVWAVVDNAAYEEWENYPEIGERDWEQVQQRIKQITSGLRPAKDRFDTAYDVLEGRAEH